MPNTAWVSSAVLESGCLVPEKQLKMCHAPEIFSEGNRSSKQYVIRRQQQFKQTWHQQKEIRSLETAAVSLARSLSLLRNMPGMRMGMASLPSVHMFKLNRWMDLGKTSPELNAVGGSYVAIS